MANSKHTPGPWALEALTTKAGANKRGLSGAGRRICDIRIYDETAAADARLIAAAPDLLRALRVVRHIVERDARLALAAVGDGEDAGGKADGAVSYLDQLDAAIARAEGR